MSFGKLEDDLLSKVNRIVDVRRIGRRELSDLCPASRRRRRRAVSRTLRA
jgi:hypothetical protein